jgi:hypothetical protein
MDLNDSFTSYLRKAAKQGPGLESQSRRVECSLCNAPIRNASEASFARHVKSDHSDVLATKQSEKEKGDFIRSLWITARTAGDGSVLCTTVLIRTCS